MSVALEPGGTAPKMTDRASQSARAQRASAGVGELGAAYAHCEAVTRSQAANFYWGIRLLPRERRRAMCSVYAFARRVDDIGDGTLAPAERLRALEVQAGALSRLPDNPGSDPVMVALADAYRRFQLPADTLPALIEGVRMDVEGFDCDRFEDLVLYARRVAGAIGRACLAIFALRDPDRTDRARAAALADDLGVALQLTNILRDLREDAEQGRVYLPAEDLRRFGVVTPGQGDTAAGAIAAAAPHGAGAGQDGAGTAPRWAAELVRFEADRARLWLDRGIVLTSLLDRRSAACVLAMAGIYARLLERIAARPERVLCERVRLSAREKALVAARSMLGRGPGEGR
jgi:15-cis-phytoene synthase